MIKITEEKIGQESYYKKTEIQDNRKIREDVIFCKTAMIKKDNISYFLLYDSNMRPSSNAFEYVNGSLMGKSLNSRIQANEALKTLLCFEEIIGKKLEDFSSSDVDTLKYFLHGFSPDGNVISLHLSTVRSNVTVNIYLSVYRGFLEFRGYTDHILFSTTGKLRFLDAQQVQSDTFCNTSYKKNERIPKQVIEVPQYISVTEFAEILKYIRENFSLREEIIVRLMFQCGLRIGEVLGLTADDLVNQKSNDGKYVKIAYIRNRTTDRKDQMAKTCMKVFSKKQYQTPEYNTLGYGYQFVIVPDDLFELIDEYIEEAHMNARENDSSNDRYYIKTIADRVREDTGMEDDNYYIFINSIGTPLSINSWNKILREIYAGVGITIDKQKRKNNLNHRFRHGFAMFNVTYLGVREVELAKLLRHSSTASVFCYYQPTISDQIKLKTDFANSLYDVIPSLKRE